MRTTTPLTHTQGGIEAVTLGDDEAKRRGVQKTVLERQGPPTFNVAVEMLAIGRWRVHLDVAAAVDEMLAGHMPVTQLRTAGEGGEVLTQQSFGGEMPGGEEGSAEYAGYAGQQAIPRGGAAAASSSSSSTGAHHLDHTHTPLLQREKTHQQRATTVQFISHLPPSACSTPPAPPPAQTAPRLPERTSGQADRTWSASSPTDWTSRR